MSRFVAQLKLLLQFILPKRLLTCFAGSLASAELPWLKNYLIRHFLTKYPVNMREALQEDVRSYKSFNDFFIRQLKEGVREIADAPITSPVDGFVSELGDIKAGRMLQAKGHEYSVAALLASQDKARVFEKGSFATLYLSPADYHRVHMPTTGTLTDMTYVPGKLFSVQPLTTQRIPNLFAKNERLIAFFDTTLGPMAVVLVGAVVVGKIGTIWQGDLPRSREKKSFDVTLFKSQTLEQADELGYFKLGSTAIVLFARRVTWNKQLVAGLKIRLGEALGQQVADM